MSLNSKIDRQFSKRLWSYFSHDEMKIKMIIIIPRDQVDGPWI